MKRFLAKCAVSVIVWGMGPASVLPVRAAPVAVVTAIAYQYAPGSADVPARLSVDRGGRVFLANLDPLGAHSLVAGDVDGAGDPLFRSPPINFSEQAEVTGIAELPAGIYAFYCDVHGPVMQGTLTVE